MTLNITCPTCKHYNEELMFDVYIEKGCFQHCAENHKCDYDKIVFCYTCRSCLNEQIITCD